MDSFKNIIKLEGINTITIKQSLVGLKKEFNDKNFLDFLTCVIDEKNQTIAGLRNSLDHISGENKDRHQECFDG